jgi:hypothetical protein
LSATPVVSLDDFQLVLQAVRAATDQQKRALDSLKELFNTNPMYCRSNSHVVKTFTTDTDVATPTILFDCKQDPVFRGQPAYNMNIIAVGGAGAVKNLYLNSPTADPYLPYAGQLLLQHEIQRLYYTVSSHAAGTFSLLLTGWVK